MKQIYTIIASLLCVSLVMRGQDGELDASFADNAGYTLVNHSETESELLTRVAVTSEGKIVMAGNIGTLSNNQMILVRLLEDGTRDDYFGENGVAVINLSPANDEVLTGMVLQGDNIIISGHTNTLGTNDFFAMRILADGSVDETFGSLGAAIVDIGPGNDDISYVLRQDANGNLLIGGSSEDTDGPNGPDLAVVRLTANGLADDDFSADGIFTWAVTNQEDVVKDFVFNDQDDVFLVGEVISSGQRRILVGALDETGEKIFAYGGSNTARVIHPIDDQADMFVNRALLLGNGGIIIFGTGFHGSYHGIVFLLDNSGAATGLEALPFDSEFRDAVRLEDGYLMCGSILEEDEIALNSFVIRISDAVEVVPTFGTDGLMVEDVSGLNNDVAYGIALQGNDKAIVAGSAEAGMPTGIYGFGYRISVEQEGNNIPESDIEEITVYPNPTGHSLTLPASLDPSASVEIFDARGVLLMRTIPGPSHTIDVSALPVGPYTIVIDQTITVPFIRE